MRVAVVGAGMSGLTAAWRLRRAGHDVAVFESAAHPGGRMWTTRVQTLDVDVGVHMLLDSFDRTRALVDELGLHDDWMELPEGTEGGVLHDQDVASFSPRRAFDVLRFRGLHLGGRLRLFLTLAEALRYRDGLDFFDLSVGDDDLDHEDCDSFSRRRLGREATDYVVDAFIRTFHFHGARKMSRKYFEALATLLLERGEFRICGLRGGMRALPEALAARLDVEYSARVTSVRPLGAAVEVSTDIRTSDYDAVVVATTAPAARALLSEPTAPQTDLLDHASYSSTIHCAYAIGAEIAGDFEGIWVPFVESRLVSAVANDATEHPRGVVPRVFHAWLHEESVPELIASSDAAILSAVATEVERLFPRYAGALAPLNVQRWPEALPVYGVGQVTRVRSFWEAGQGERGVWLCGDYLNHPWVEGAIRCGEKVAKRMMR